MKEKIEARIEALSKELEMVIAERQEHISRLQDIEVRVHQLVGSIQELHSLLKEGLENELKPHNEEPKNILTP